MAKFEYNVMGEDRRHLVTAISGILGFKARYTGVPRCSYVIGFTTVTREGIMEVDDNADGERVRELVTRLAEMGFTAGNTDQILRSAEPEAIENETADAGGLEQGNSDVDTREGVSETISEVTRESAREAVNETSSESNHEVTREEVGTTISVPRVIFSDNALENLRKIVKAKSPLLRKAFVTDSVEIEVSEEAVSFPWFGELTPEDLKAFSQFIEKLCKFAIASKRITSKERRTDNERFAMRTWLIRLGCIGDEYRDLRKKLLAPLSGDAAWRFGRPEKEPQTAE